MNEGGSDGTRLIVSAAGASIVEQDGAWVLHAGSLNMEYDDLGDALKAMNLLLPEYPNQVDVDYHVELDELTLWADEDEGLLPQAANGWLYQDIGWMPVETAEDPTGSDTVLERFGSHGADVFLHQWNDTFAIYRSGVEGEGSQWVACDATDLAGALAEAETVLEELLDEQGVNFPQFMCLDNLPADRVYPVPDDAVPVQRRTSLWSYGGELICELTVYRHEGEAGTQFLVVDDDTNDVIGEYESLNAIDEAEELDAYEKLKYETVDIDSDDDE